MKIKVQVIPRASKNAIEKLGEGKYKVWVTVSPVKGKANEAVIELLADHFGVSKSAVKLVSGFSARTKIFEVDD